MRGGTTGRVPVERRASCTRSTTPMGQTAKRWVRRVGTLAALGAIALLVSACSDFNLRTALPPEAASVQGEATRNLYLVIFAIGVAIFVLVEGLILFAVLRYRRRDGDDELPPQIHGNNRLEIVWTAIPIAIVLALFALSWQTLNTVDAHTPTPPIRIGVVAYQWQWQFVYAPDGVAWQDCNAQANQGKCVTVFGTLPSGGDRTGWSPPIMHVPVNETVELQLHSMDVIHSFYVPAFLYQRDITPGKDQVIQFTADRIGTYRGQCTQFCGLYHEFMEFQVQVESKADYDAWLQQQLAPPPSPSAAPAASAAAGSGGRRRRPDRRRRAQRPAPRSRSSSPRAGSPTTRPTSRRPPTRPSRSTSRTTTRGSPTTSRSMRARPPARRSSRARSSPGPGPGPTTCRPCRPARTPSSAPSIRTWSAP